MNTFFQEKLQGICRHWAAGVKRIGDSGGRMAFFRMSCRFSGQSDAF